MPEAPDDRMLYLAPTAPLGSLDTEAELHRANAGGFPKYSVSVKSPAGAMAVSASRTECPTAPDGTTWQPVKIRGVEGCEWTNGVGLYFLEWTEGTTRFHYESFSITGLRARKILEDWEPLEPPPGEGR